MKFISSASSLFFTSIYLWERESDLGGENKQGVKGVGREGGLAENFKISLFTAYFQLLDMELQELFTELKCEDPLIF